MIPLFGNFFNVYNNIDKLQRHYFKQVIKFCDNKNLNESEIKYYIHSNYNRKIFFNGETIYFKLFRVKNVITGKVDTLIPIEFIPYSKFLKRDILLALSKYNFYQSIEVIRKTYLIKKMIQKNFLSSLKFKIITRYFQKLNSFQKEQIFYNADNHFFKTHQFYLKNR